MKFPKSGFFYNESFMFCHSIAESFIQKLLLTLEKSRFTKVKYSLINADGINLFGVLQTVRGKTLKNGYISYTHRKRSLFISRYYSEK
jgi:hypothetical protein